MGYGNAELLSAAAEVAAAAPMAGHAAGCHSQTCPGQLFWAQ